MAWLQLTLESTRKSAERLSELLEKYGVISVSLSALSEAPVFGQDVIDNAMLWERTRISALLHEDTDLDTLLVCLRSCAGDGQILKHRIDLLQDRDWVTTWQQGQGPKIFGERLRICPSWCSSPDDNKHYIILDPGLAFGTGAHDTTAMCLDWLAANDVTGKQVIDYGCGSGILALAALHLGAQQAYAIDIDPQALQAARTNAERNRLLEHITIAHPDEVTLPAVNALLANVLLNPLKDLAPYFAELVLPGGAIVLSGLVAVQAEECLEAYQSWFNMDIPVYRREWAMLHGIRKQIDK